MHKIQNKQISDIIPHVFWSECNKTSIYNETKLKVYIAFTQTKMYIFVC